MLGEAHLAIRVAAPTLRTAADAANTSIPTCTAVHRLRSNWFIKLHFTRIGEFSCICIHSWRLRTCTKSQALQCTDSACKHRDSSAPIPHGDLETNGKQTAGYLESFVRILLFRIVFVVSARRRSVESCWKQMLEGVYMTCTWFRSLQSYATIVSRGATLPVF